MVVYLFDARALSGGFDGGQTDSHGHIDGLDALGDGGTHFGSHDTQITESLKGRDDFNFILGDRDLALVGQQLGHFSGQLKDISVGLAFVSVLDAVAASHASQRKQGDRRVGSVFNQRLEETTN